MFVKENPDRKKKQNINVNLIYYETNIKVKNYLNLLIQKNYSVINKPTRVSRNNATIIDHINANHFLNNDMHSGIIAVDILDHFLYS